MINPAQFTRHGRSKLPRAEVASPGTANRAPSDVTLPPSEGVAVSERRAHLLRKALAEARIWRDESLPRPDRQRARRRFDRALSSLGLDPVEKIQAHLAVVAVADAALSTEDLAVAK